MTLPNFTPFDSSIEAGTTALHLLNIALQAVGLGIAIRTFRRGRKWGYLLLAIYFGFALFGLAVKPYLASSWKAQPEDAAAREWQKRIDDAVNEAVDRVYREDGAARPSQVKQQRVSFPAGSLLLVAGIWLLARKEAGSASVKNAL